MADDKSKRGPRDRERISIHQMYERRGWAALLGITQTRLREAVKAVGPMVKDVKAWLIERIQQA